MKKLISTIDINMDNQDENINDNYNELSEKAELIKELREKLPILKILDEKFGNESPYCEALDAIDSQNLGQLRDTRCYIERFEHLMNKVKYGWNPYSRKPGYKELLGEIIANGVEMRFLKICNQSNKNTDNKKIKSEMMYKLSITDSPVAVYVREGTSKEEVLDFLKKAPLELEKSWGLVSQRHENDNLCP